jgi:hypothetical protein
VTTVGRHSDRVKPVKSVNGSGGVASMMRRCGSLVLAERGPRGGGQPHKAHQGWSWVVGQRDSVGVTEPPREGVHRLDRGTMEGGRRRWCLQRKTMARGNSIARLW